MAGLVVGNDQSRMLIRAKQKRARNLEKKKEDPGELPKDHTAIDKLLDPIHYTKSYKSEINNLESLLQNLKAKRAKQVQ